jgi:hypothetical protein
MQRVRYMMCPELQSAFTRFDHKLQSSVLGYLPENIRGYYQSIKGMMASYVDIE